MSLDRKLSFKSCEAGCFKRGLYTGLKMVNKWLEIEDMTLHELKIMLKGAVLTEEVENDRPNHRP